MNGGDLDAARVIGRALRLVSRPTSGPVRQQGQSLAAATTSGRSGAGSSSAARISERANEGNRKSDDQGDDFHSGFAAERLYSIDFNEAVCQDAIRECRECAVIFVLP